MTKGELIDAVYGQFDGEVTKKTCADVVESVFDHVTQAIKKEHRWSYPGLGTFSVRKYKARMGRNPQTGQAIKIKARKRVTFKCSASLKDKL